MAKQNERSCRIGISTQSQYAKLYQQNEESASFRSSLAVETKHSRHISQSHPPIAFAGVAVGSEVVVGPSFGLTGLGAALSLALVQMSA